LPDVAAKKRALRAAAAVSGVGGIGDRLRVCPAATMDDRRIARYVRDALLAEPALSGCALRVRHARALEQVRGAPDA
jgi:hypothetical protein